MSNGSSPQTIQGLPDRGSRRPTGKEAKNSPGPWSTTRRAKERFRFDSSLLWHWRKKPCVHLASRKLHSKIVVLPDARGYKRKTRLYLDQELEQIARSLGKPPARFHQDGSDTYLSQAAFTEKYGSSASMFFALVHGEALIDGKRARAHRIPAEPRRNQHGAVWMLHEGDAQAYLGSVRTPGDSSCVDGDGTWLSENEAFRQYGVAGTTLRVWRRSKKPGVLAKRVRLRLHGNNSRLIWVYRGEDLKRIVAGQVPVAQLAQSEPGSFTNGLGTWLSARAAIRKFGFSHSSLRSWRTKACWKLNGKKLRALLVDFAGDKWHPGPTWVYFAEDLAAIAEKKADRQQTHKDAEGVFITAGLAEQRHGMDYSLLHWYRGRPCQHLENRKIRVKKVRLLTGNGGARRPVWVFHEEDVNRIAASLKKLRRAKGKDGRFVPKKENGKPTGGQAGVAAPSVLSDPVRDGLVTTEGRKKRPSRPSPKTKRILDAFRHGNSVDQVTARFQVSAKNARVIKSRYRSRPE